jgi:hypothetical protein
VLLFISEPEVFGLVVDPELVVPLVEVLGLVVLEPLVEVLGFEVVELEPLVAG